MANKNLELWDRHKTPDPEFVKDIPRKYGGALDTVDAQYIIQKATEEFGPYGMGFGLKDIAARVIDCESGERTVSSMMVSAEFWYKIGEDVFSFPVIDDMEYKPSNDTSKKLQTQLTKKALSKLGFAADVYMSKFDDEEYVKTVAAGLKFNNAVYQRAHEKITDAASVAELEELRGKIDSMVGSGKDVDPELVSELHKEIDEAIEKINSIIGNTQ